MLPIELRKYEAVMSKYPTAFVSAIYMNALFCCVYALRKRKKGKEREERKGTWKNKVVLHTYSLPLLIRKKKKKKHVKNICRIIFVYACI